MHAADCPLAGALESAANTLAARDLELRTEEAVFSFEDDPMFTRFIGGPGTVDDQGLIAGH